MKTNKKTLLVILIGLAVADLLGAIDATGVNIALPTITKDLAIPVVISQWIPNAYTLVLVSMLIFMGKVGDIVGAKKLYLQKKAAEIGQFCLTSCFQRSSQTTHRRSVSTKLKI